MVFKLSSIETTKYKDEGPIHADLNVINHKKNANICVMYPHSWCISM